VKSLVIDVGGTNVKVLPPKTRRGNNVNAFTGGIRLWGD
jgi:hypothetical protein